MHLHLSRVELMQEVILAILSDVCTFLDDVLLNRRQDKHIDYHCCVVDVLHKACDVVLNDVVAGTIRQAKQADKVLKFFAERKRVAGFLQERRSEGICHTFKLLPYTSGSRQRSHRLCRVAAAVLLGYLVLRRLRACSQRMNRSGH